MVMHVSHSLAFVSSAAGSAEQTPRSSHSFAARLIRRTPLSALSRWGAEGCDIQWAGVGRCETRERARRPLGSYRKSFRHLARSIWSMGAAYGHIVVWHHHLTTHRTNGGCDGLGRPRAGLGRPPDPPSDRSIPCTYWSSPLAMEAGIDRSCRPLTPIPTTLGNPSS